MSVSQNEKERLISSWPQPVARLVPRWIPYRILLTGQYVVMKVLLVMLYSFLILHEIFGSTDMWGAKRDRAKDREWARKYKLYKQEEAYWKPPALTQPRKRRLSLPLDPALNGWSWWWTRTRPQQSFDQQQSLLGRLPEELRLEIYRYLVAGKRLHIQESYRRVAFVECEYNSIAEDAPVCDQLLHCLESQLDRSDRIGQKTHDSTGNRMLLSSYEHLKMKPTPVEEFAPRIFHFELLSLAKTCRLLYTGYLDTLYATTTFAFTSVIQFHAFSATISPHRLNMITALEFYSEVGTSFRDRLDVGWEEIKDSKWKKAWEVIATMSKLRYLHVDLRMEKSRRVPETSSSGVHTWMEDRICDPMRQIQHLDHFHVSVNWVQSQRFVLGNPPFEFERRLDLLAWSEGPNANGRH